MSEPTLHNLVQAAARADKKAASAFSYEVNGKTEHFSAFQVNELIRTKMNEYCKDYKSFRRHKNEIFELIEEVVDERLPAMVEEQYMQFAEVKNIAQGDKYTYRRRITAAAKERARGFVTRVGLAGRYETFMLDGESFDITTSAIGAACRIGFEEFLDGRIQFGDLTEIIVDGMDRYIYLEIANALGSVITSLPTPNKATVAGFDEDTMDELLAISDSYGHSTIYCTFEFAAKMRPADNVLSNDMKNALWTKGMLGDYKGHSVVILPQSLEDITNTTKAIDPSHAYIIPAGAEKPVKLVFEGQTCVRDVDDNDDWSRDLQTYKKFGIGIFANHWMSCYTNSELVKATRS